MPAVLVSRIAAAMLAAAAPGGDGGVTTAVEAQVVRTGDVLEVQLDGGVPVASPTLEPPRLLEGVAELSPVTPDGTSPGGTVELALRVSAEGAVVEARLTRAETPALGAAALHAAPRLRFAPALLDGQPVEVWLPFTWTIEARSQAQAQAVLSGQVLARGTREPVASALVRAAGVEVVTDVEGRFRLELPRAGAVAVEVAAAGHEPQRFEEVLSAGEAREVRYRLHPVAVAAYETVVREQRERTEVASISLRDQEVHEVAGTLGDPFRVVMQLPGVAGLGSGLAYPVVRGSQPAATGFFVDGVRVPLLFHLLLGPSVVHPDFIEGIDFYPGAPPARFGRQLGGAVEGRVRRPRGDRLRATASVDLLSASGLVELPLQATDTHVTVAGRFSYSAFLLAAMADDRGQTVANFGDYQVRVDQRVGQGRARLLLLGAGDLAGSRDGAEAPLSGLLGTSFHRLDARLQHPLADGEVELGLTWGTDELGLFAENAERRLGEFSTGQATYAARAGWQRDFGAPLTLRVGADVEHRRAATTIDGAGFASGEEPDPTDPLRQPSALGTFAGLYGELTWRPTGAWRITPGVRVDSYHRSPGLQYVTAEPRLAVRYQVLEPLTLKAGAGLFHQAPTMLIPLPTVDVAGLSQGLQRGVQVDVGAEWRTPLGLEVAADAYVNPLLRSVEFSLEKVLEDRRRRGLPMPDPSSRGLAYGLELLVRKPLGGGWFGWASYGYTRSVRELRFTRYDALGLPAGIVTGPADYAFEQAHVLNTALSVQLPGNVTVGGSFHLNTGRPESGELSSRTRRLVENGQAGGLIWTPVDRDRVDRLPTFVRLDLRASKDFVFDDLLLQLYADVFNVTFSREVFGYEYQPGSRLPGADPTPIRTPLELPLVVPLLGVKGSY